MWTAEKPDSWNGDVAVILAHGAGQGMRSPFMRFFHTELSSRGMLSVEFDFEYMEHGRKAPDPQAKLQARYRNNVEEVRTTHRPTRCFIGGKSMGGRVASYIAGDLEGINGLIFLGYPLHPPGKTDALRDEHLYTLKLPMLFISGTRDSLARRDLLDRVVDRIGKRATMVWIEGGDHSLKTGRADKTSLPRSADAIENWIRSLS